MNNRGTAGLETVAMIGGFVLVLGLFLALTYLWFAKSYIGHQSEQALLCLAEDRSALECRQRLQTQVARMLPFGRLQGLSLHKDTGKWTLNLEWGWKTHWLWKEKYYVLRTQKQMSLRGISRAKVAWP